MSSRLSEAAIRSIVASSIEEFGAEHTHDFECRTWRGQNWAGSCNCSLPNRVGAAVSS